MRGALATRTAALYFSTGTSVPLLSRWMCENGTGTPVMLQQRVRVLALLKALVAELLQQAVSPSPWSKGLKNDLTTTFVIRRVRTN